MEDNRWNSNEANNQNEQNSQGYNSNSADTGVNDNTSTTNQNPAGANSYSSSAGENPAGASSYSSSTGENPAGASSYSSSTGENPAGTSSYSSSTGENPAGASSYSSSTAENSTGTGTTNFNTTAENNFDPSKEAKVDYSVAAGQSERVGTSSYNNAASSSSEANSNAYSSSGGGGYTSAYNSTNNSSSAAGAATNAGTGSQFGANAENMAGTSANNTDDGINGGIYNTSYNSENGNYGQRIYNPIPDANKNNEEKKKKSSGTAKKWVAAVLVVCLCGCAGFGGGALAINMFGNKTGGTKNVTIDSNETSMNAASVIAEKVMPSVVGISTVTQTYTETIFGLQQGVSEGIGTGIIVSEDGYILTNSHVVENGDSSTITVDLYDGTEYDGSVLWSDSSLDLAIVKVNAKNLTPAELGDSEKVGIGDYAVAIGNPLGLDFERSVTQGIISGLDRTITTTSTDGTGANQMEDLIQTDASINSGNSGGPLINSNGQVVGINTAKASSAEGLGFAIPINVAIPIIEEIKETGTYEQSYLGIAGLDLSVVIANYETDFKAEKGVYIQQIYTNSPAAKVDLKEGDIITKLDGKAVDDMSSLKKMLVGHRPGDEVTLTIERDKATQTVKLTLGSSEDASQSLKESAPSQPSNEQPSNGNGYYYYGNGSGDLFGGAFGN